MAGGLNKRGGFGPMSERIARTSPRTPAPAALPEPPPAPPVKPCWVTDHHGRLPALLLEWRKVASGAWQGRVVRPVLGSEGWVVVEEWLPAAVLDAGA